MNINESDEVIEYFFFVIKFIEAIEAKTILKRRYLDDSAEDNPKEYRPPAV
jgi:hypothetical protein